MPLPSSISDLSTVAASNYPSGSDSPSTLDDTQRAHASFIAKIRDLVGLVTGTYVPATAASNMGFASNGANTDITSLMGQSINKNLLINGGFTINQRAYVSAAVLASGSFGHDRWKAGASGGDYSFTQLASNTQITIASGKSLIQVVEDKNVQATRYVLSWAGTAQARIGLNSATPSGAYAASPIVVTGQTVGTTMSVEFNTGTLGTVQLESSTGSVGTVFEQRPYGLELSLCQRYFQSKTNAARAVCGSGLAYSTTNAAFTVQFPVSMRSLPVLASSSLGVTNGAGAYVAGTSSGISGFSGDSCLVDVGTAGGLTQGHASLLYAGNAGGGSLIFTAEL